jgi:hypothetical protein
LIVGTYPRKEYREMDQTLKALGLVPNGALLVEEAGDGDD